MRPEVNIDRLDRIPVFRRGEALWPLGYVAAGIQQCLEALMPRPRLHQPMTASKGKHTLARQEDLFAGTTAAIDVEGILRLLEGRWKLVILFHLFGGKVRRFSDLEKLVTGISQKMLAQQLRQLEDDGIVTRAVHHQMPAKVDYRLTEWGRLLCPALDALLVWAERRDGFAPPASSVRAAGRAA